MVKLVDTRDLKSLGLWLCRFKPGSGYQDYKGGYSDVAALLRFSRTGRFPPLRGPRSRRLL